jgi:hypothetical protein
MAVQDLGEGVRLWTREEWHPRPPKPMTPNAVLREAFIHHTTNTSAEIVDSLAEQKAAVKATQDFHMLVRGYADLAYAYLIFQPFGGLENARVFQGRETRWVPAGQFDHNTGTVPICVYGNFARDDGVKPETITAIVRLLKHIQEYHDDSLRTVGGHRDVVQTSCPGNTLYAKIPEIARRAGLRRFPT